LLTLNLPVVGKVPEACVTVSTLVLTLPWNEHRGWHCYGCY
jgi:hypothetical protein